MSGVIEEMILEEKRNMALRMLKTGKISIEEAAGYLDLPPEIKASIKEKLENNRVLIEAKESSEPKQVREKHQEEIAL